MKSGGSAWIDLFLKCPCCASLLSALLIEVECSLISMASACYSCRVSE